MSFMMVLSSSKHRKRYHLVLYTTYAVVPIQYKMGIYCICTVVCSVNTIQGGYTFPLLCFVKEGLPKQKCNFILELV